MGFEQSPAEGETIECAVCIIGAGPAGLTVASVLAGAGRDVILLESGGTVYDPVADSLNEGQVFGDPYAGLRATRRRQLGGAAAAWNTRTQGGVGAKFVPLDPVDFEPREAVALSGWPISFADVAPWYVRAHAICGLGAFVYDAEPWSGTGREPLSDLESSIVSRIYRFGSREALLEPMLRALEDASNARVITRVTALALETDAAERLVSRVRVAGRGATFWVAAQHFVLCGGAVENARVLLASGPSGPGLGNARGWVGRCFMEHPRDASLTIAPMSPTAFRRLRFYDAFEADGFAVCGRFAIREEVVRREGLLNASATLLPIVRSGVQLVRRAFGPAASQPLAERLFPRGGHGWSAHPAPRTVLGGFRVLLNLEQAPDPENRIVLSEQCDPHGVRRAALHWQWRERDEASRHRVLGLVASTLERAGLNVVRHTPGPIDPNAHHHAGTTRMHGDPRLGVVDADCRVHGTENLYVAGASVFPTAGYANPVLTIVALSLRLAEHLRTAP
ncbi:MAG TPA: GMC family oxidoreductase [Gemmatimonadaceae bacterium]|nr:GMC family oxidoreductase [Gemmatimonadaceae bacterium]